MGFSLFLLFLGLFYGGLSLGQFIPPLSCSANPQNAIAGQLVTVTAVGGAGGYLWYVPENNLASVTSPIATVSFQTPGTRNITVNSAGLIANCTVNVSGSTSTISPGVVFPSITTIGAGQVLGTSTGPLLCNPQIQSKLIGQPATFTASGGIGNYIWTAPGVASQFGNAVSLTYFTSGTRTITLTSGSQQDTCTLSVSGFPTLPNTGEGGARFFKR